MSLRGFYSHVLFPRLCDFLLRKPFVARHRSALLARAFGDVLEIGFGTGLNLPFYPGHVRKITTVDPNAGMRLLARRRIRRSRIEVDQCLLSGENLPFADESFDCVVSTFTLCSIDHVDQALGEVHRVLRSGGRLLILEHGLSRDPSVQKWQRRLNWVERLVAEGCRLDRDMRELVQKQRFSKVEIAEFYLNEIPKTHVYIYRGEAVK